MSNKELLEYISLNLDFINKTFERIQKDPEHIPSLEIELFNKKILELYEKSITLSHQEFKEEKPDKETKKPEKQEKTSPEIVEEKEEEIVEQTEKPVVEEKKTEIKLQEKVVEKEEPEPTIDETDEKPAFQIDADIPENKTGEAEVKEEPLKPKVEEKIAEAEEGEEEEKEPPAIKETEEKAPEEPKAETILPKEKKEEGPLFSREEEAGKKEEASLFDLEYKEQEKKEETPKGKQLHEKFTKKELSLNEKIATSKKQVPLADKAAKSPITDIKAAITLNMKLTFIKELYQGDQKAYKKMIDFLSKCRNYSEAKLFLQDEKEKHPHWNEKEELVGSLMELITRRFR